MNVNGEKILWLWWRGLYGRSKTRALPVRVAHVLKYDWRQVTLFTPHNPGKAYPG